MATIETILIANRGEIACRIIKTCKQLEIRCIAVYAEADRYSQHVKLADLALPIGAAEATASYLDADKVIQAAKDSGADAIHPGYGFLSENADFARKVEASGLIFIGPGAEVLELMASKAAAKTAMESAGVACVPGYHLEDQDDQVLAKAADTVGYPLLIKAVAGGGGKGMRICAAAAEFTEALAATRREALRAFADDRVILERYIENPRHIEVQVFADQHGNTVHLFERDCSSQRRYQKVIEESPAPGLSSATKAALYKAAIEATQAVNYVGAGTIEFILAQNEEFWFMEMNTRLQVEHPVTEMLTGIDLVEWQILVAQGQQLPLQQADIHACGHALEVRLYAEDPSTGFLPAAGIIKKLVLPTTTIDIRCDSGVVSGDRISVHYDPMIAKLIVHANAREAAIAKMQAVLMRSWVCGLGNNLDFLQRLLNSQIFQAGQIHTAWIDQHLQQLLPEHDQDEQLLLSAAAIFSQQEQSGQQSSTAWANTDGWRINSRANRRLLLKHGNEITEITAAGSNGNYIFTDSRQQLTIKPITAKLQTNCFEFECQYQDKPQQLILFNYQDDYCLVSNNSRFSTHKLNWMPSKSAELAGNESIIAPMPGNIIEIRVQPGDAVEQGEVVAIMEAMKMELSLRAEITGIVTSVNENSGGFVDTDTVLVKLSATGTKQ